MPASCGSAFTAGWRRLAGQRLLTLLLVLAVSACSGGRLTTDRAYSELKPKQQLPERELRQLPENLIIKIHNVADEGRSYRNFVVLYINGREISPVEQVSNFTSTYTYPLRLQHGLYEVKAEYHDVGFWREQVYDIIPDEPVKVLPEQRTTLEATIVKDHRGRPAQEQLRFRTRFENLSAPAEVSRMESAPADRPILAQPAPAPLFRRKIVTPEPEPLPRPLIVTETQPPAPAPPLEAQTVLQINSSPSGAEVIIDDRFHGQTPLKVAVRRDQNHVIQLSRAGHQEVVKVLDAADLQHEALVQLLFKLEPVATQ